MHRTATLRHLAPRRTVLPQYAPRQALLSSRPLCSTTPIGGGWVYNSDNISSSGSYINTHRMITVLDGRLFSSTVGVDKISNEDRDKVSSKTVDDII